MKKREMVSTSGVPMPAASLIAAILARKSNDQSAIHEDARSVTRQTEHAKAYAAKNGWTVTAEHVYSDDGVTGTAFGRRIELKRLLADLDRKPRPFDVLIMMETARLGREQIESLYLLKQVIKAGVRVFDYLQDREITLNTPMDKFHISVIALFDEMERNRIGDRAKDALMLRARAGHVAGGRTFGFDNVPVDGHVERRINDAEAAAVRRAFQLYAGGLGFRKVADRLNREHASTPHPRKGRPAGWSGALVRDLLHRPLYHGEVVWNKIKKHDRWGERKTTRHPEAAIIRVMRPELKIVSDALWDEVQARLNHQRDVYVRSTDGRLHGRPLNGVMSRYMLTGLATCASCGAGLTVRSRSHGTARLPLWACRAHVEKGSTACANRYQMRVADADRAVLDALEANLLDPDVVERALSDAVAQIQQPADHDARRATLQTRLRALADEENNLTAAVALGGQMPPLMAALRDRAREKETIVGELVRLDGMAKVGRADGTELKAKLQARIAEWRQLLSEDPMVVRQLLGKLLDGRLTFRPAIDDTDGTVSYTFEGRARMDALLAGVVEGFGLTSGGRGSNGIRTRVSALRGRNVLSEYYSSRIPSRAARTASDAAPNAVASLLNPQWGEDPREPWRTPEDPRQWQRNGNGFSCPDHYTVPAQFFIDDDASTRHQRTNRIVT